MDLKERLLSTISKFGMVEKGDKVILGVSGGPDSICLLHLMSRAKEKLGINIVVAHLDHMFRGAEAEEDAQFVKNLCDDFGVPFFGERLNVPKYIEKTRLSPEDAARRLRYNFFSKLKKDIEADKVATGHNRNDHEETVLMNILRGSGLDGLLGIDPVRDYYIRPLIEIPRQAIELYLDKEKIPFRTDSSNLTTDYFRNSLRLELIPTIEEKYCSHLGISLRRLSEIARQDLDYIEKETMKVFDETVKIQKGKLYINICKFSNLHGALKMRLLRKAVERLCGDTQNFEYRHTKIMTQFILNASVGSVIDLPKGLFGEKRYEYFVLSKQAFEELSDYCYKLNIPGKVFIRESETLISAHIEECSNDTIKESNALIARLDYDKIKANLIVRNRRPGDRFVPLGSKNSKKLKDFFIDEKIPRRYRNNIPILECCGEIIWVGGMRIDDRFKVTSETKTMLVLKMGNRRS